MYATLQQAVEAEIIEPIMATGIVHDVRVEYDVTGIALDVLGTREQGYECLVDEEAFWASVEEHQL